jgi:hypothetical protein
MGRGRPPHLHTAATLAAVVALAAGCAGPAGTRDTAPTTAPAATRPHTTTTTTTTPPPAVRRYALAGDSVAVSLWPSVQAAFAELDPGVAPPDGQMFAALGSGITADARGWSPDGAPVPAPGPWTGWAARVRETLATERPDVVVVLSGVWDAIAREVDGARTDPGTPAWRAWYRPRVRAAADTYASAGSTVVWLLPQCTGDPRRDAFLAAVRGEMRAALSGRRSVAIVDLDALACPDGHPVHTVATGSGPVPLLESNGIHFAHDAAVPAAAPWLASELRRALGLADPATNLANARVL